ncbi:MAG: Tagatose-bisphosphate aldolase [uncultured bacterium]|nr:MAG: Tagatose-bisphosphate aldolase [uncultured bacterium]
MISDISGTRLVEIKTLLIWRYMLTSSKDMLLKAQREGYAVGAFNISNLETLKAIMVAAEKLRSPLILQIAEGSINYAGLAYIAALAREAAQMSGLPIAIHLDHGKTLEMIKKCIDLGFNSVMIDGSHLSLADNIVLTKEVVDLAHSKSIDVEGEIGKLSSNPDDFANPVGVKEFVDKTNVDYVAVGIGSSHGVKANLDLDLLYRIKNQVDVPLVLHGGSGVSDDEIKKVIKSGICKINIHTEIRKAFIEGFKKGLEENPTSNDMRDILKYSMDEMQKVVEEKIQLFGSGGKI